MAKVTKEKILDTALIMFAEKGYEGTNMREIAESLGLVKSSLYKHFESKEDIWNNLIYRIEIYYSDNLGSSDNMPKSPKSLKELKAQTLNMINFTMHDERIILIRKILHSEQFRDNRVKGLATDHFITRLEKIFTKIFTDMMEDGLLKKDDPSLLAFEYTTPITALIHLHDREPEKEEEITKRINSHIDHFINTYGVK